MIGAWTPWEDATAEEIAAARASLERDTDPRHFARQYQQQPRPAERRCETNVCGQRGECEACGAVNGESCRKAHR